jgi:hypothetical protein
MCIGDLEPTEILQAIRHPEIEVDFGVAPPDWLILWGVDWNEFPLPMAKQGDTPLTAPPMGPAVERTMRKRWREGARHELKNLLYQEWAGIGELPIVKHTPVT